jgi:putative transposase
MDLEDLIRSGKIKRFFRATRKLNVPQLVLHITQRAAGKEPLFLEDADYLYLVWLLKEISTSHHLKIYAFCLMPNHLHLLFSTEEPNLYDAMRDLFARYATRFNRKYGRRGHLFGGPYRQAICLDDSYLIAASLYLHLNPVRANLADDPQRYRWSSCRLYCDPKAKESFVDPHFVLGLFPQDPKVKYRQLLEQARIIDMGPLLEEPETVEKLRFKLAAAWPTFLSWLGTKSKTASRVGIDLCSLEELEEIKKKVRQGAFPGKPETRKAKKFLIEQLLARGFSQTEIARQFDWSRKTVYNLLHSI